MRRLKQLFLTASVVTLALGASAGRAAAQGVGRVNQLSELDGRASGSLKAQVAAVADSIERAGLPVAPLVDKTLEGISKGADERRIMAAVRSVASDLGVARRALGPSSDGELVAAVAVLRAGSTAEGLTQLRRSLPGRPLVVPLSVLASLLVDGAPASSAIVAVATSAKQRNDSDLLAYGRDVSRNIASGVAPLTAMSVSLTSVNTPSMMHTAALPTKSHSTPKPKP
jgi:hypothetical protein